MLWCGSFLLAFWPPVLGQSVVLSRVSRRSIARKLGLARGGVSLSAASRWGNLARALREISDDAYAALMEAISFRQGGGMAAYFRSVVKRFGNALASWLHSLVWRVKNVLAHVKDTLFALFARDPFGAGLIVFGGIVRFGLSLCLWSLDVARSFFRGSGVFAGDLRFFCRYNKAERVKKGDRDDFCAVREGLSGVWRVARAGGACAYAVAPRLALRGGAAGALL